MRRRISKVLLSYIPNIIKTGILSNMPSLYDLFEISPTSCNIMITNRCNLKCIMCGQWSRGSLYELTTGQWKDVINDLKSNKIKNIHFTGGEPLLRTDLSELIAYCTQMGFVTGLTTNGMLVSKDTLLNLIDAGLRSIALSIDSLYGDYERIRGVDNSFVKVEEAAKNIARYRARGKIDAYINFTLMKENLDDFKEVKSFADNLELPVAVCLLDKNSSIFNLEVNRTKFWIDTSTDGISAQRLPILLEYLKSEKLRKPSSLLINFSMIDFISKYFDDPRMVDIPCVSSQDRVYIDPYGNLLSGCLAMGNFGNIKDISFGKLIKDAKYRTSKKNMFYKRCTGCSCGYQYNISHCTGLILKDVFDRIKYSWKRRYGRTRKTVGNNSDQR